MAKSLARWIWHVLISADQFVNASIGPILNWLFMTRKFGYPDETLSSVLGKMYDECKVCRFICKILNVIDPRSVDHCKSSIEEDEGEDARKL